MKQWIQTITGVLAIVGLGYFAGVGQSFFRTHPIILGSSTNASNPGSSPDPVNQADPTIQENQNPQNDPSTDPAAAPPADPISSTAGDPEFNARLDAEVPEGMLTLRQGQQKWIDGAYFIDARKKAEYELGHVSGAAHLNAETFFTKEGEAQMQTIPPDATVVVYCVGGLCDASENVKALLEQFGYTNLSVMGIGYDDWAAAGLPVNLGDDANESSTEDQP